MNTGRKVWVVMDRCWYLTNIDGVYASQISDGVRMFTEEEANELCKGKDGFHKMNVGDKLRKLLLQFEERVRLDQLEIGRIKKMIDASEQESGTSD